MNDGGLDPGDRRCYVRMVDGDDSVQWSPSTGFDNYALLDDVPPNDSTYVETETDGHVDRLSLEDIPGVSAVHGITYTVRARKTTAEDQQLIAGVDSNGALATETLDLSSSFANYYVPIEHDPNTSLAWEEAAINALLAYREASIP